VDASVTVTCSPVTLSLPQAARPAVIAWTVATPGSLHFCEDPGVRPRRRRPAPLRARVRLCRRVPPRIRWTTARGRSEPVEPWHGPVRRSAGVALALPLYAG
jgi:hypothetical protein